MYRTLNRNHRVFTYCCSILGRRFGIYSTLEQRRNCINFWRQQYAICIFHKFQMHSKVQFTNSFSKKKFLRFEQYVSTMQDCIDHCWLHKLLNSCMTPQRKTCQSTCTYYNVSLFIFKKFNPEKCRSSRKNWNFLIYKRNTAMLVHIQQLPSSDVFRVKNIQHPLKISKKTFIVELHVWPATP